MRTTDRRIAGSLLATVALVAQALVVPAESVRAADPVDVDFFFVAGEQTFVVPEGVTTIRVFLRGGRGGGATASQLGWAHQFAGDLDVTPGQTLYLQVAGIGGATQAGGFNGGGNGGPSDSATGYGGGGASDIRTISRHQAGTLASRLMVAAGGGGGGGGSGQYRGGNAGSAGQDNSIAGTGGGPGTAEAGGAGGSGGTGAGADGGAGVGGNGGGTNGGGGGGGGGWYGGGGGSSGWAFGPSGAGGGGGSSYVGEATNTTSLVPTTEAPMIRITYTPATDPEPDPEPSPDSDSGAVAGMVTAAAAPGGPCLIVGASTVDFGTNLFSDGTGNETDEPIAGQVNGTTETTFAVENCGDGGVQVLARGTEATSRSSDAAWALGPVDGAALIPSTCSIDGPGTTNVYGLLDRTGITTTTLFTHDSVVNDLLESGQSQSSEVLLYMPCVGSDGAGEIFDLTITYTAMEP